MRDWTGDWFRMPALGRVVSGILLCLWVFPGAVFGQPIPPQIILNTTYAPPSGGTTHVVGNTGNAVTNGTNFQAKLDLALPGDIIVLQAGATYRGHFILRNKAGTGWIYIQSSAIGSLPPPGERVAPADAAFMPRIEAPSASCQNDSPAIRAEAGAHNYRLVGLEVTAIHTDPNCRFFALVLLGDGNQTWSQMPRDIVIDRSYIHGNPTGAFRLGVYMLSTHTAVIDSYVSDFHEKIGQGDAIAVAGNNSPGPFKVVNNYLEASAEGLFFGGGVPSVIDPNTGTRVVPADIEIRRNYMFKPSSWLGAGWAIKNLFEIKSGQRVLLEGNIMENNWVEADQHGYAIVLTPRDHAAAVVQDVTFRKNIIRHSVAGASILGRDYNTPTQQTKRILFENNLFHLTPDYNPPFANYHEGKLFQLHGACSGGVCRGAADVWIDHNTLIHDTQSIVIFADNSPNPTGNPIQHPGLIYRNNISNITTAPEVNQGVIGTLRSEGIPSLQGYSPGYIFQKNVLRDPVRGAASGDACGSMPYPAGNFCPRNWAQVQFVDFTNGDFRLAASSPYNNAGTDGKDIGADMDAVLAATQGVEQGIPPASPCVIGTRSPFTGQPFAVPGTFAAEDFDCGGEGLAYHDNVPGNAGGQYRTNENVDIFTAPSGFRVANFETGEWLSYSINVAKTDSYRLELSVATMFTDSRFHIEIDGVNVTGSVLVPNTGNWNTFQWVGATGINLAAGAHVLKIVSEQQYFDVDAVRITGRTPFTGTPFAVPATFQAEDFDQGGEGVAYHDLVPGNAGGQYRTTEDVDIFSNSPNPGLRVANFNTGEWLSYSINVAQAGAYRIEANVSSTMTNTRFHFEIDGAPVTGSITVPTTPNWITFNWVGAGGINLTAGTHVLKIVSEQEWFDIDALRVVP